MKLFRYLMEQRKYRSVEKYEALLLQQKIRLADVPEWLRFDARFTHGIHIAAFRVDRATTRKDYEDDLNFVGVEIALAQAYHNTPAEVVLKQIYERAESDLEYALDIMRWKE